MMFGFKIYGGVITMYPIIASIVEGVCLNYKKNVVVIGSIFFLLVSIETRLTKEIAVSIYVPNAT